jgi:bacteriocin biosynthesis cyclodehydratase domain-containing protein
MKTRHRPIFITPSESERTEHSLESLGGDSPAIEQALISLLDGTHSYEEIWGELLLAGFETEKISRTLESMERAGFIGEAVDSDAAQLSDDEKALYAPQMKAFSVWLQGSQSNTATAWERSGGPQQLTLRKAVVVVVGSGLAGAELLRALSLAGIGQLVLVTEQDALTEGDAPAVNEPSEIGQTIRRLNPTVNFVALERTADLPASLQQMPPNLLIYCPDDFDEAFCEWLNETCLQYALPLLVYRRRGAEVEVGPMVIPRDTACYVCYERRRQATMSPLERQRDADSSDVGHLNFALGVDYLAMDVIKFLTDAIEPVTRGRMMRLNFASGIPELHPVLKLPRCPACGVHKSHPKRRLWEE